MAVRDLDVFPQIRDEIITDLADNYVDGDEGVLESILTDVINDALSMANRSESEANIIVLCSNIKKACKTIYLQRGVEDVRSNSQNGLSNTYEVATETMMRDIIRQNKRRML